MGAADLDAAQCVKPRNKRVVVVKPVKPHVYITRRSNVKAGNVWQDGYWRYNKRARNYIWVNGRAVKQKRGKVWVSGRWTMVRGGWAYSKGFWA